MRDKRFVAVHQGGDLSKEHHRLLIRWARECTGHVMPLIQGTIDNRITHALLIAEEWEMGRATTGDAMKSSVGAHAAARESSDPVTSVVARSAGHAVATAHMADHSLGAALYALKAVKHAGKSVDAEKTWQIEHLPSEIADLVLTAMREKEKSFKL
jgi:hypothetical protein